MITIANTRLLLVLGLLTFLLAGCQPSLNATQREWLETGQTEYEAKRYSRAIELTSRFLAEVKDQPEVDNAHYLRGMAYAQSGRRDRAYADLKQVVSDPHDTDIIWRAHVVLSTLYFEDGNWAQAAKHLQAATERMPRNPKFGRDTILYRLAVCYERLGRWDAAEKTYRQLHYDYPDSTFARPAEQRIDRQARHYAVQCGAFSGMQNAERLRDDLKQKGLDAWIRSERRRTGQIHLVLVGKYASYEQAESQKAMIRQNYVPDAIVWP